MRRARTPASLLRRLDALSTSTDTESRRGGVLLVPPILSIDEWEQVAVPAQRALMQAGMEDTLRPKQAPVVESMPGPFVPLVEGVHYHRPDPNRSQTARPKETTR